MATEAELIRESRLRKLDIVTAAAVHVAESQIMSNSVKQGLKLD